MGYLGSIIDRSRAQLINTPNARARFTTSYKLSTRDIIDEVDLPHQDRHTAKECGGQSIPQLRARLSHDPPLPHTSPFGYLPAYGMMYGFERRTQTVVHTLNNGIQKNHQHLQIPPLLGLMSQQLKLIDEGMEGQPDFDENPEFDQLDDTSINTLHKANHLDEVFSDIDNSGNQTGKGPSDDSDPFVDKGYVLYDSDYYGLGLKKKRTTIMPLIQRYVSTIRASLWPDQLEHALRKKMSLLSSTEGRRLGNRTIDDTFSRPGCLSGVSPPDRLWKKGNAIVIKFLNGPKDLHDYVIECASVWFQGETPVNLKLEFIDWKNPKKSDVRILFSNDRTCHSRVGTTALDVKREDKPTMVLGIQSVKDDSEWLEWRRWAIQHEFGHMLGFYHEHSSPNCTIKWKSETTFRYYSSKYRWARQKVLNEILRRHDFDKVIASAYDHESVMHYPVKPFLAKNNIVEIGYNKISKMDWDFLADLYPLPLPRF